MQPRIQPLAPATLPDLLAFFDGDAFSDNPKWASCYCQCFYEDHRVVKWSERTAAQNRTIAIERGNAGTMQGWLAYVDGAVVGWCNAAPRLLHGSTRSPSSRAPTAASCALARRARGQRRRDALLQPCDGCAQGLGPRGQSAVGASGLKPNCRAVRVERGRAGSGAAPAGRDAPGSAPTSRLDSPCPRCSSSTYTSAR